MSDTVTLAGCMAPYFGVMSEPRPLSRLRSVSNIIITTPEEAQEAVRLLDDRIAVVEQNVQDLSDRLTQIRNKVKTAIKALQWLAQLHLPADQGGSLRRGSGHVRADAETVAIKELQE